jgi:HAD superfamily hydrolase (TIGR01509 family)
MSDARRPESGGAGPPGRRGPARPSLSPPRAESTTPRVITASMRRFDVVSFDVGHTLVTLDTERVARVIRESGIVVTTETIARADRLARADLDDPELTSRTCDDERWLAYLRALVKYADLPARARADEVVDVIDAENTRHRICDRMAPEAPAMLARLRSAGYRLVVISNSGGEVRTYLESIGLASFFETIIDSFVVKVEKPDPRIFGLALEPLGVSPRRAVHVGDLYHVDVVGAERAGWSAVLLDPSGTRAPAGCASIRALADIDDVIGDPAPRGDRP